MTDLPERLREAAGAHRPDRARMLAKVEHAMALPDAMPDGPSRDARGHDRPAAAPWMRVTAVTAAVAGAIGIGGLAVGAVTGDAEPATTVVTSGSNSPTPQSPAASGAQGGTASRLPAQRHPSSPAGQRKPSHAPAAPHPTGSPTAAPPANVPGSAADPAGEEPSRTGGPPSAADGPLGSNGVVAASSNTYWTQSDVVLTSSRPLTSLTVELRIARSNGEASTGSWTSLADRTGARLTVEGDELVYRWTLNAGQTADPGTYTFSAQFNHAEGQGGTDGDRYTVTAGFGSGGTATVGGGF